MLSLENDRAEDIQKDCPPENDRAVDIQKDCPAAGKFDLAIPRGETQEEGDTKEEELAQTKAVLAPK